MGCGVGNKYDGFVAGLCGVRMYIGLAAARTKGLVRLLKTNCLGDKMENNSVNRAYHHIFMHCDDSDDFRLKKVLDCLSDKKSAALLTASACLICANFSKNSGIW